jgi:hypothetical protein
MKKLVILLILILALFALKAVLQIDPDFGWRLKHGETILLQGVAKSDPFSYTMPSFPFVDHAWPVSMLFAFTYSVVGYGGLALFFSALFLSVYLFITLELQKGFKNVTIKRYSIFGNFVFVAATAGFFSLFGIRAQVFTWLFFGLLIVFLWDRELWNKYKLYLPLYFLVWANFHGGFASGLLAVGLYIGAKSVRLKKIDVKECLLFGVSFIATLINPYGIQLWREVWSSVADSGLRWEIEEWKPSLMYPDFAFWFLAVFTFLGIIRYKNKFLLEHKFLYFIYLLQAVAIRRNIPLWIFIAIPVGTMVVHFLQKEASRVKLGTRRFNTFIKVLSIITLLIFSIQTYKNIKISLAMSEKSFYPQNAVYYLKNNIPQGEIFSEYGWGGYLVWKLPEKKVFIDGRMPSWEWKAPQKELDSAFDVYRNIITGNEDHNIYFEQFGVGTVLYPKNKKNRREIQLERTINNLLGRLGYTIPKDELIERLIADNWIKVYEDDIAVVYRKKVNQRI